MPDPIPTDPQLTIPDTSLEDVRAEEAQLGQAQQFATKAAELREQAEESLPKVEAPPEPTGFFEEVWEVTKDVPRQAAYGALSGIINIASAVDSAINGGTITYHYTPDGQRVAISGNVAPMSARGFEPPRGVVPALAFGLSEFMAGWAAMGPVAKLPMLSNAAAKAPKLVAAFRAASADVLSMNQLDPTTVTSLASLADIELGPIAEYVETDKDDNWLVNRLRHGLASGLFDGALVVGYKTLAPVAAKLKRAKGQKAIGELAEAAKLQEEALADLERGQAETISKLSDAEKKQVRAQLEDSAGLNIEDSLPEGHPVREALADTPASKPKLADTIDESTGAKAGDNVVEMPRNREREAIIDDVYEATDEFSPSQWDGVVSSIVEGKPIDELMKAHPRLTRKMLRTATTEGFDGLLRRVMSSIQDDAARSKLFKPMSLAEMDALAAKLSTKMTGQQLQETFMKSLKSAEELPVMARLFDTYVQAQTKGLHQLEDAIATAGLEASTAKLLEYAVARENIVDLTTQNKVAHTLAGRLMNSYRGRALSNVGTSLYTTIDTLQEAANEFSKGRSVTQSGHLYTGPKAKASTPDVASAKRLLVTLPSGRKTLMSEEEVTAAHRQWVEQAEKAIDSYGGRKKLVEMAQAERALRSQPSLDRYAKARYGLGWDMVNLWLINSLLSGPFTHAINFTSGVVQSVYLPMERMAGGSLIGVGKTAKNIITGKAPSLADWEQFRYGWHTLMGLSSVFTEFKQITNAGLAASGLLGPNVLADGNRLVGTAAQKAEIPGLFQMLINSPNSFVRRTSKVVGLPLEALAGADEMIQQVNFRAQLKADSSMFAAKEVTQRSANGHYKTPEALATYRQDMIDDYVSKANYVIEQKYIGPLTDLRRAVTAAEEAANSAELRAMGTEKAADQAAARAARDAHKKAKAQLDAQMQAAEIAMAPEKAKALAEATRQTNSNIKLLRQEGRLQGAMETADMNKAGTAHFDTIMDDPIGLGQRYRDYAARATYTEAPPVVAKVMNKATQAIPALRLIIPFVSTPTNVLAHAARLNPVMWTIAETYKGLKKLWMKSMGSSKDFKWELLGEAGADAQAVKLGQLLLGTGMAITGLTLASEGVITGAGPSDPEARRKWIEDGKRPYSVKIGSTYYPIGRINPIPGVSVMAWADVHNLWEEHKGGATAGSVAAEAWHAMKASTVDQSFFQGLKTMMDALDKPESRITTFIENVAGGLMPASTLNKQLSRITSGKMADSSIPWQRFRESAFMFGLGTRPEFYRRDTITGKPLTVPVGETLAAGSPIAYIDEAKVGETEAHTYLSGFAKLPRSVMPISNIGGINLRKEMPAVYDKLQELRGSMEIDGMTLSDAIMKYVPQVGETLNLKNPDGSRRTPDQYIMEGFEGNPYYITLDKVMSRWNAAAKLKMLESDKELRDELLRRKALKAAYAMGLYETSESVEVQAQDIIEQYGYTQ